MKCHQHKVRTMSQTLTEQDYLNAATALKAPLAAVKAVATVESAGSGFFDGGRVKVQYEPHVMFQRLQTRFGLARAVKEMEAYPDLVSRKPGSYQSLDAEDKDMDRAAKLIDRDCALESASWGAFQIMGYHWHTLKFPKLQDFINAQYTAQGQLDCFVRFVLADPILQQAIQQKRWAVFAARYNGKNFAANKYDTKMAEAYKRFGGV